MNLNPKAGGTVTQKEQGPAQAYSRPDTRRKVTTDPNPTQRGLSITESLALNSHSLGTTGTYSFQPHLRWRWHQSLQATPPHLSVPLHTAPLNEHSPSVQQVRVCSF